IPDGMRILEDCGGGGRSTRPQGVSARRRLFLRLGGSDRAIAVRQSCGWRGCPARGHSSRYINRGSEWLMTVHAVESDSTDAAPPSIPPFTERQLPAGEEIFLDHIAHFVPDQPSAAEAARRAGFAPTPVSVQTNPRPDGTQVPTGTSNITAMLARGYIEILFK